MVIETNEPVTAEVTPPSAHDKRQRKQAIVNGVNNDEVKIGTITEEDELGSDTKAAGIKFHITPPENDSGNDTETGTPSIYQTEIEKDKDVKVQKFLVHPVYEKRPQRFRKISSYSADSEHSGPISMVVPSRKGSTVMIHEQPEIIQGHNNYLSVHSNDSYPYHEYSAPRQHKISVFSCYSQASRASFQSDKTFRDPLESFPNADNYGDKHGTYYDFKQRPTLYQLRSQEYVKPGKGIGEDLKDDDETDLDVEKGNLSSALQKMGWIQGVLIRCVLNIFGVMLFLRLTWITGQAGIGFASLIILLSSFVTAITTMSMSAICTNGEVKGGGAYYMISRSLGPEFGGAIGVVFSLANAVAAAMYIVGFAETVRDLLWENDVMITGNQLHDVRIIGCFVSLLILAVVLIGLDFEAKAQVVLLVILLAAIVNYFVGTLLPPSLEQKSKGFNGYSVELFNENMKPDFREGNNFFSVFAIFFPAATGILAGANISGDLKNASKAIPKGTFLSILLTSIVYLGMVWCIGSSMLRDASGLDFNVTDTSLLTVDLISQCPNATCSYGLHNDNAAVGLASAFRHLITAGIFSATLSSALASMVSAPKVFQALGKDKLFPFIHYFAVGFGKAGEPKRGYFLTFAICIAVTCIGALDLIAPIISNFFLMAYALINFSCFNASFANTPGFRPAFKFYNKWISLMGSMLCVGVMFLINWWAALVSFVIIMALYVYLKHRKPDVNWGSSSQAHAYKDALQSTFKLTNVEEHVKNFRPQILVLSGYPRNRPALVDFVSTITKKQSLLICGQIFMGDMYEHVGRLRSTAAYKWFKSRDIKSFYTSVVSPNLRYGAQVLLQSQGLGKLRPNTLILGYKNDWQVDDPRAVDCYFNVISDAFDLHYGIGILRLAEGLDVEKIPDDFLEETDESLDDDDHTLDSSDEDDNDDDDSSDDFTPKPSEKPAHDQIVLKKFAKKTEGIDNIAFQNENTDVTKNPEDPNSTKNPVSHDLKLKDFEKEQRKTYLNMKSLEEEKACNRFKLKQEGTIDVWWLFDDGGLTLLIPYILSTRKQYKSCKLRVFCAGTKRENMEEDHRSMATLLSKFRIEYTSITVIPDLKRKPKRSSYKEFEAMIYRWRLGNDESSYDYPWKISDSDLIVHKQKTYMQIKLREKLLEYSSEASLIVMTLPVPRKVSCPAGLYMAWLEMLTNNLPPTLLLRGNQQSVLTYFS